MKLKLIIGLFALIGYSQAWAVPCSDSDTGVFLNDGTQAWASCEDGGATNDPFPGDLIFGGMTFEALSKQNTDSEKIPTPDVEFTEIVDINLVVSPLNNAPNGTWAFDDIGGYLSYIIVLKGGGTAPDGDKWAAYLLDNDLFAASSTWSGTWIYGQNANNENLAGLSHLSVYGKVDPDFDVPAPAILGIMGIGLIGMVFSSGLRRRKTS